MKEPVRKLWRQRAPLPPVRSRTLYAGPTFRSLPEGATTEPRQDDPAITIETLGDKFSREPLCHPFLQAQRVISSPVPAGEQKKDRSVCDSRRDGALKILIAERNAPAVRQRDQIPVRRLFSGTP